MGGSKFAVTSGGDSEKGFFSRNIKLIALIIVAVVLVVGVVLVVLNVSGSKRKAAADKAYQVYEGYYSLEAGASDDDIRKVISDLTRNEASFSEKSPAAARLNFYKADLYDRIGDATNRISCLEKVAASASSDNYLLPISLYDLAVAYESDGNVTKAAENYYKVYEVGGKDSELSDISLFALYRIYHQSEPAKAEGYKKILEDEFKDSEYTRFLLNIGK